MCHGIEIFMWTAPVANPDLRDEKLALIFGVSYE